MRISDTIEQFIKALLEETETEIELKRNELAEYFSCAPSQINYVLATRFTLDQGYVIESKRGGGGYIRIVRLEQSATDYMTYLLQERIGQSITLLQATQLIQSLYEQEIVTHTNAQLMLAALSNDALTLPLPAAMKDELRARILKNMIVILAKEHNKERK
ncbi:MAG: CtsR family transcriptional regulator [Clostridiales bacterium]|nr:CtsR family transcriptional regulator [Clostridiales bacterium]